MSLSGGSCLILLSKITFSLFFLFISSTPIFPSKNRSFLRTLVSSLIFGRVLPCHLINLVSLSLGCEGTFLTNTTLSLTIFCFVLPLLSLSLEWEETFLMNTMPSSFLCSLFKLSLGWEGTFFINATFHIFFVVLLTYL